MGAFFIGAMFFFDFQIALRGEDGSVHAILDLFPDVLGVLILAAGVFYLSARKKLFSDLRIPVLVFFPFSVFTSLKHTLFFSSFYAPDGGQNTAGEIGDLVVHLLKIALLFLLLSDAYRLCFEKGEKRVAAQCLTARRLGVAQGVLYLADRLLPLVFPALAETDTAGVLSLVSYLFWIAFIWICVIALARMMLRTSPRKN